MTETPACFVSTDRFLEEKKRKKKLQKQGMWEEVKRRERLDEEGAAEEAEGRERAVMRRGAGSAQGVRGDGDAHMDLIGSGGRGRADDEEGASFAKAENVRY